jgi:hypothetical protein
MSNTVQEDPRHTPSAKIHHLTHLVNAITNQLSACMSLNSLLKQCIGYINTSTTLATRAEDYHASLNLSQKSLATIADYVQGQLKLLPESPGSGFEPGVNFHSLEEGAYASLKVAAQECAKVPDLLQSIADHQEDLDAMHRAKQWQGWPKCTALEELEDLNQTLLALRDSGANSDVGWGVAWRQLVDVGIWYESPGGAT